MSRAVTLGVTAAMVAGLAVPASASAERALGPVPEPDLGSSVEVPVADTEPSGDAEPATRVSEVVESRTESSATYELSDGSLETVLSAGPIHVEQADGSFAPIDTDLALTSDGWSPAETAYDAVLPERADGQLRFAVDAGSVELALLPIESTTPAQGELLESEPLPVEGTVDGAQVVYEDVAGATTGDSEGRVDVALTATPTAVKEELVLADATSPRAFWWSLRPSAELTPQLMAENEVHLLDADGQVVLWMPAPFMTDHSGDFDVRSSQFDVSLERDGDAWRYGLVADDAWLDDPDRVWPVTIDPTVTHGRFYDCTLTSGSQADVNYCASDGLRTGRTSSGWVRRTVLDFDVAYTFRDFDILPANILSAELSLAFAPESGPRRSASLHRVNQAWNNGATWNRRTATNTWTSPGGSIQAASIPSSTWGTPYDASATDGVWGSRAGRLYWYPTRLVQEWVDGTVPDHGFLVKNVDETVAAEMRFHSGEAADWRNHPELKIQWTRGIGAQERYTQIAETAVTDRQRYSVNVGTGNLYLTASDLTLAGVAGHDLGVERAYNSLRRRGVGDAGEVPGESIGDFGIGWSSTLDSTDRIRFYASQRRMAYTHPSGWTRSFFDDNGDGTYTSPQRSTLSMLRLSTGHYEVTDRETRLVERFAANGRLLSVRDGFGNAIRFSHDAANRVSRVTDTRGGGIATIDRNAVGRITRLVDHTGREHRYGYSGDNLVSYTDSEGSLTRYVYGQDGKLSRVTDPTGRSHDLTYRSVGGTFGGAVATTKRPRAGTTTNYAYSGSTDSGRPPAPPAGSSPLDHQITVTDARGNDTRYYADRRGRILKVLDPRGIAQSTSYRNDDFVVRFASQAGNQTETINDYSNDGFLNSVTTPMGSSYSFGYGGNDEFRPASYLSPQGNTIAYGYGAGGQLNRVTDAAGSVSLNHASDGFVTSMVNQRGHATTYTPTPDGRRLVAKVSPPGGYRTTEYEYDAAYRLVKVTDGRGKVTVYDWDDADRITSVRYHDGSSVAFTYDANGRRIARTDASGAVTTVYDVDGNVLSETYPDARGTHTYVYDVVGNLTRHTDTSAPGTAGQTDYAYGPSNLLTQVTEPALGSGRPVTSFVYESNSNDLDKKILPASTGVVEDYQIDRDGRIERLEALRGGTLLTRFVYRYDDGGARRSKVDWFDGTTTRATTYGYDGSDRLRTASTPGWTDYAYTYDAASNRTSQTVTPDGGGGQVTGYAYDVADQLCRSRTGSTSVSCSTSTTQSGVVGYVHDAAGNLVESTAGLQLSINDAGQSVGLSSLTGTSQTSAAYAGVGQSVRRTLGQQTFTTALTGVTAGKVGAVTTRWVRDVGGNLLSQRSPDGSAAWYLSDGLGSAVAMVDGSGQVRTRYTYDPYGVTAVSCHGGGCVDNPWRFTGEYQDPTGMYKIGERYLSPELGRWTQADPASNRINPTSPGEPNPYAYAGCDPINNTDPTGQFSRKFIASVAYWAAAEINCVALGYLAAALFTPFAGITVGIACNFLFFAIDYGLVSPALAEKYG